MSADSLVLDFIHDLDNQGCPDAVSRSFQALIEKFGFTYFCMGSIKPHRDERGMVWATSFEHPWFKHWVESGRIHIDPVVWRMKRDGSPFRWASLREQPDVPHAEVIDEAAALLSTSILTMSLGLRSANRLATSSCVGPLPAALPLPVTV